MNDSIRSSWRNPLPENEIGRQQNVIDRLHPEASVELRGMGSFRYAGIWDTMHSFYPAAGQTPESLSGVILPRYMRRDPRGVWFVQLPYTMLADYVIIPD